MPYLDYNATAPLRPEALEAMLPYLRDHFGNPSSIHAVGRKARVAVDEAREQVADLLGVSPRELVFTAGATEANNLALQGFARRHPGAHVASSALEHPSVMETLRALEEQGRIRWSRLPFGEDGAWSGELAADIGLLTLMLANNETGVLLPVAELAPAVHRTGGVVHVDVTQAAGRIAVDLEALGADMAALSAHKLGGPKGIGAFFVKRGTELEQALHGGKQERSRRPGTENVAAIVGFGAAAAAAQAELAAFGERMRTLRDRLWSGLQALPQPPLLNTPLDRSVPNTLNVSFAGLDGNYLLQRMDMLGLSISSGSACASGTPEPSPVLTALGYPPERVKGALRFSLGWATTEPDVDEALAVVRRVVGGAR